MSVPPASPLMARLALAGAALVVVIVAASAYLRLHAGGIGCQPWPECYRAAAPLAGPSAPDPLVKAARLAHRVAATLAAALVLAIFVLAWRAPRQRASRALAAAVLALTVFLAVLGTRTAAGAPIPVALGNLLGGFLLLAALAWLRALHSPVIPAPVTRGYVVAAGAGTALLLAAMALGALTSVKGAALGCPDLPRCHGAWWPPGALAAALNPLASVGAGALPAAQAAPLHMAHRALALIAALAWLALAARAVAWPALRPAAAVVGALAALQPALGAALVERDFPLALAVAHNGAAALWLAAALHLTTAAHRARRALPASA